MKFKHEMGCLISMVQTQPQLIWDISSRQYRMDSILMRIQTVNLASKILWGGGNNRR